VTARSTEADKAGDVMNYGKAKFWLAGVVVSIASTCSSALAQCAMCKSTVEGDPQAAAASHQLDLAVLVLLIPPVLIFIAFFALIYRFRSHFKNPDKRNSELDAMR
jgi:heme/copper-type cytochrome/quinol oxidase subunit 2